MSFLTEQISIYLICKNKFQANRSVMRAQSSLYNRLFLSQFLCSGSISPHAMYSPFSAEGSGISRAAQPLPTFAIPCTACLGWLLWSWAQQLLLHCGLREIQQPCSMRTRYLLVGLHAPKEPF